MIIKKAKLRSIIKRHGGKGTMAGTIVDVIHQPLLAPHNTYVEPFAGGLSVLLSKPRVATEVVGDLESDLIAMWRAVRDRPSELLAQLRQIDYSRATFTAGHSDPVAHFIVRSRMSRGGLGQSFAWSDRQRGGQPGDVNAWQTMLEQLPQVAARMKGVRIADTPAVETVRSWDSLRTLIYVDPPYLHETRTARRAYDHEMTRDDHACLLDALASASGYVALSGYRSALYDSRLTDWRRLDFERPNDSGQGRTKQRRTECLWLNW